MTDGRQSTVSWIREQLCKEPITAFEQHRFWKKTVCLDDGSRCIIWTGAKSSGARSRSNSVYGSFWFRGRTVRAHLFAFAAFTNEPELESVDHACERPLCVEHTHLVGELAIENSRRGALKVLRKRLLAPFLCAKLQPLKEGDVPFQ